MRKTNQQKPKICLTAGGILIIKEKVLLIKHKKLNMWLNPGGHMDENELPHETAEREFFEETGIKVKAVEPFITLPKEIKGQPISSKYLPSPILTNLHWISKQNWQFRTSNQGKPDNKWSRGCEQHLGFTYLMKLADLKNNVNNLTFNQKETTDVAWVDLNELDNLTNLNKEIFWEVKTAAKLIRNIN